ncbi:MAG: hypothetical protein WA790_19365 [Sulfitobacter sp.]
MAIVKVSMTEDDVKSACMMWAAAALGRGHAEGCDLNSSSDGVSADVALFVTASSMNRDARLHSKRTLEGIAKARRKGIPHGRSHFVLAYPDRLDKAREISDAMLNGKITGRDFVALMHEVQPEPRIKSVQSFYNWRANGFKGLINSTKEEN